MERAKNMNSKDIIIKIPNNFIKPSWLVENHQTYSLLFVYSYIANNLKRYNHNLSSVFIKEMIKESGWCTSYVNQKTLFQFVDSLKFLKENNYFDIDQSISSNLEKSNYRSYFRLYINSEVFNPKKDYTPVYANSFYKIFDEKKYQRGYDLLIVWFIYCYLTHDIKITSHQNGTPEIFFKSQKTMSEELLLSAKTIAKYLKFLEDLKLITSTPISNFPIMYVLNDNNAHENIKRGETFISQYKTMKYFSKEDDINALY